MNQAKAFYNRSKSALERESDLPSFFTYYLTIELERASATVKDIRECYEACDLAAPSWLASHFSNGIRKKPRQYIKADGGYRLENKRREGIELQLGDGQPDMQISAALNRLEAKVAAGPKRDFLHETIKCFNAGANRAAVVMCWSLAAHHLQDHILADTVRHAAFNGALANNKDTRVKIKAIGKQDDFTEMPEGKFLEFSREAKIITSTVYNKLKGRLDDRNGAAHPSGVTITAKIAEAYIEDLVENVLKKYPA